LNLPTLATHWTYGTGMTLLSSDGGLNFDVRMVKMEMRIRKEEESSHQWRTEVWWLMGGTAMPHRRYKTGNDAGGFLLREQWCTSYSSAW